MQQSFHIFRKDLRYLRLEIGLYLVLHALFVSGSLGLAFTAETLILLSASYLIARVIQAEAIPGSNQFWISRPYQWRSLLLAKLVFIALVVNVPVFLARFLILARSGFAASDFSPGLIWSQLILFLLLCLPIAAIASITPSFVSFFFVALAALLVPRPFTQLAVPPGPLSGRNLFEPLDWVWNAAAASVVAAGALLVLYTQYSHRRNTFSRVIVASATAGAIAAFCLIPWRVAMALELHQGAKFVNTAGIQTAIVPQARLRFVVKPSADQSKLLDLPIRLTNLPEGLETRADGMDFQFRGKNGHTWKPGAYQAAGVSGPFPNGIVNALVTVPGTYLASETDSVTFQGQLYLTLFGDSKSKAIPISKDPIPAIDRLACFTEQHQFLSCMAPLGWPNRLLYAQFTESNIQSFSGPVSYSPFPSGFGLDPTYIGMVAPPDGAKQVTIITKRALQHVSVAFQFRDLHLADFIEKP